MMELEGSAGVSGSVGWGGTARDARCEMVIILVLHGVVVVAEVLLSWWWWWWWFSEPMLIICTGVI